MRTCYDNIYIRNGPRFFEQVDHKTMLLSSGNKRFFTKSCHCWAYQNYEQPPQASQNSDFQSYFSKSKYDQIFQKKILEESWNNDYKKMSLKV